ncbi:SH3 domain-containing protein [Gemmata sp. G18]|uniref:SH3 domain-containing protein n=1 Tax=Gemmata palustris TaxID=2822762 RepID=A0ABS5BYI0_9BACT|nr:SH3 domain-containing protein [Gemmata palustris]MBP3958467.1 SH3 domain-containing protein [Gemmata palustris]
MNPATRDYGRRWFAVALALLLSTAPVSAASPEDTLAATERAFAEGVEARGDSDRARPAFARAASGYDELWARGYRTTDLALNRSRAHRLAGNLPRCIAALHDGLAVARFARELRVELEDARSRVLYPSEGELALQGRPRPVRTVSTRLSHADAWVAAGFAWLLACGGVVRFVMTRNALWLAFVALWVAALGALGALWVEDSRQRARDESLPLLVVTDEVYLRRGNATEYPTRIEPALPKGAEVRELTRRGGWVQVQLPGGVVGWLPESATIPCGG